jgi:hypothetical protein
MRSHLLEGTVRHRRARPFVYSFAHDVYYAALDLSELDEVTASVKLIGHNRPNVVGFRDDDHFMPPADDLREAVIEHLRVEGVHPDGWRVTLITNLRVLGYVFNPASFYLCRDRSGTLQVVIVEVHNTHRERHLYTLRRQGVGPDFVASMDKDFYVSPFVDRVGHYTVRVRDEPARLRISINEAQDEDLLLHTSIDLTRRRLTDRSLVRMLLGHPFVTHKTTGMIHWHALQLWRRGARFHRHGEAAP